MGKMSSGDQRSLQRRQSMAGNQ
ncbi:unnamed protein product [Linum tenue]|uniref:Uncharacterized protein n=1 Tax=Linum tenue TaxID=586396 RepID=A0AAV0HHX6_9ROSI|nr:unnamed protein product [Linum tenue]